MKSWGKQAPRCSSPRRPLVGLDRGSPAATGVSRHTEEFAAHESRPATWRPPFGGCGSEVAHGSAWFHAKTGGWGRLRGLLCRFRSGISVKGDSSLKGSKGQADHLGGYHQQSGGWSRSGALFLSGCRVLTRMTGGRFAGIRGDSLTETAPENEPTCFAVRRANKSRPGFAPLR